MTRYDFLETRPNLTFDIFLCGQKANYKWRNYQAERLLVFSSAVPPGSGAFQMPTCPSSSASASTLRGGRANLRNASVTFSLF